MPPQDANPTPSFGGFGLRVSDNSRLVLEVLAEWLQEASRYCRRIRSASRTSLRHRIRRCDHCNWRCFRTRNYLAAGALGGVSVLALALQYLVERLKPPDRFHILQPWRIPDPTSRGTLWLLAAFDALLYLPVYVAFAVFLVVVPEFSAVLTGVTAMSVLVIIFVQRYWRMRRQYEPALNRGEEKGHGGHLVLRGTVGPESDRKVDYRSRNCRAHCRLVSHPFALGSLDQPRIAGGQRRAQATDANSGSAETQFKFIGSGAIRTRPLGRGRPPSAETRKAHSNDMEPLQP